MEQGAVAKPRGSRNDERRHYMRDYEEAITEETKALLKVHPVTTVSLDLQKCGELMDWYRLQRNMRFRLWKISEAVC